MRYDGRMDTNVTDTEIDGLPVRVIKDPEGPGSGYLATCDRVPNGASQGETAAEALANLRHVISVMRPGRR